MAEEPNEQTTLVPVRTQEVDFYGDTIPAGQLADGTILVPLRPVVEAMGLAWAPQRLRLNRDPVLSDAQGVIVMITPSGRQEMLALPLKLLPGFLFGLNASRVKPELRDRILRYQRECYDVLWDAFKGDIQPNPPPPVDLTPAQQTLQFMEALYRMAQQQVDQERRLDAQEHLLSDLITYTNRTDDRLTALELHLSAGATISEAQAAELALAVKNVAAALEAAGTPNGYQRVYSELYRRYRISSYKALPAARYAETLAWLHGWSGELA